MPVAMQSTLFKTQTSCIVQYFPSVLTVTIDLTIVQRNGLQWQKKLSLTR